MRWKRCKISISHESVFNLMFFYFGILFQLFIIFLVRRIFYFNVNSWKASTSKFEYFILLRFRYNFLSLLISSSIHLIHLRLNKIGTFGMNLVKGSEKSSMDASQSKVCNFRHSFTHLLLFTTYSKFVK